MLVFLRPDFEVKDTHAESDFYSFCTNRIAFFLFLESGDRLDTRAQDTDSSPTRAFPPHTHGIITREAFERPRLCHSKETEFKPIDRRDPADAAHPVNRIHAYNVQWREVRGMSVPQEAPNVRHRPMGIWVIGDGPAAQEHPSPLSRTSHDRPGWIQQMAEKIATLATMCC